jgi:hypothetical protein
VSVDVVSIPLGTFGLLVAVYRLLHRDKFPSANLTVLAFALGTGLLVRSPWLGDTLLDDAIGHAVGWWNVPDLVGHLATFTAMAAALAYFARALGYRNHLWNTYLILAVFAIVCFSTYSTSPARTVKAANMVQLEGMAAYTAVFSGALLITHAFGLFIARHGRSEAGWRAEIISMFVGTIAGIVMAVHRLLVLAVPSLSEYLYDLVTWTATLLCIGGYLAAAYLVSVPRRTHQLQCA